MRYAAACAVIATVIPSVLSVTIPFNVSSSSVFKRDAGFGFVAGTASWTSKPGPFLLTDSGIAYILQSDGNLIVYDVKASSVLWNSGVTNQDCSNARCTLGWHSDGNLVAYTNTDPPGVFWSTGTNPFSRHEIQGYGLFFASSPPYIQIYSQAPELMWMTNDVNGVVVQNPDTKNDPLQNNGQFTPPKCQGVQMNCAVCFRGCFFTSASCLPNWDTNAKTFGDTNPTGIGPASDAPPPLPEPPNPCANGHCDPDPCINGSCGDPCDNGGCDPDPCDDGSCGGGGDDDGF